MAVWAIVFRQTVCEWVTLVSRSFWIQAAMDCLRIISDGMISVECRHMNLNQTYKFRITIRHFRISEPLTSSRNPV